MIYPGEKHGILSIPGSHPLSISTICPDMTAHLAARNRKEEVEREIAQGPSEPVPKMSDERGKLTSPSFILCSSKRKKRPFFFLSLRFFSQGISVCPTELPIVYATSSIGKCLSQHLCPIGFMPIGNVPFNLSHILSLSHRSFGRGENSFILLYDILYLACGCLHHKP